MVSNFHLPPTGYGPGSQPTEEDGQELQYISLPQDMRSYSAHVPDVDAVDGLAPALGLLKDIAAAATRCGETGEGASFDLSSFEDANRRLIAETMGQGEVSVKMEGIPAIAAQESVFAGVWVLNGHEVDRIEVGPVPKLATDRAFVAKEPAVGLLAPKPKGVVNAPALIVELLSKSAGFVSGTEVHVVNLTLLPHTEPDLAWMEAAMGKGSVTILSRGYGNCRITATGLPHVWRVQFFNSMDTLILDTFEVTDMPEVALAAPEDLIDSGERILEVLEAIR